MSARVIRRRAGSIVIGALLIAVVAGSAGAEAQVPAATVIHLDGAAGGPRFDGIGVVDGGGATSVLLKDYPEAQRQQILDLIYKPKFGASVSALYVEIPGDGNSTQGSMPSHMHTRTDLNYARGYTWWVMMEARRRNPQLSLDGAGWSAPGWIGADGGSFGHPDQPFFSQDGVDYYISWLKGLRRVYGLDLDAIGVRNEKGVSYGFAEALRAALDSNGFSATRLHAFDNWQDDRFDFVKDMVTDDRLRHAIDVPSAHVSPVEGGRVSIEVQKTAAAMGKPLWNTEQHVYQPGFDGLISTVRSFNEGHIASGFTKIVDWYGIAGLYEMEPYSGEKEALVRANWPWSGRYLVNEKLWAFAHYGQFSQIGWRYLNGGSGELGGGGSYVTLMAPSKDYSVIIETKGAKAPQRLRLDVTGLSTSALSVWRSTEAEQFVRQPDLPASGTVDIVLQPDAVYTLSTTRGQVKGGFGPAPAAASFPLPYRETFDGYGTAARWGYLPHYFADIDGAFELAPCPHRGGGCLRQSVPMPANSWAPGWKPYSIIGDDRWSDYAVRTDVYLKPGDTAGVMGRVNNVGSGYGSIPKGYYLSLSGSGELKLVVVRGKIDKKALVGDAEQQALIKAGHDTGAGGEAVLAAATLPQARPNAWHSIELRMSGSRLSGLLDGKVALTATDALYARGMAGLLAGAEGAVVSTPVYDNFEVGSDQRGAGRASAVRAGGPIYSAAVAHRALEGGSGRTRPR